MDLQSVLNRNFPKISGDYHKFACEKDECRCCSIYEHYNQVGQSEGNAKNPTFMFIGESLGQDEVAQVRPFVGRAGQRMRSELRKHKPTFNRNTCLVSNVLSCRPLGNKFPGGVNAKVYWHLIDGKQKASNGRGVVSYCADLWVMREIKLLKPKVIVIVGGQALEFIRGERGITAARGEWKFLAEHKAWSFAIFHPSYVLRCENSPEKEYVADLFEQDIKKIAETWRSTVENDPRMQMPDEEFERVKALEFCIDKRMVKDTPLLGKDRWMAAR